MLASGNRGGSLSEPKCLTIHSGNHLLSSGSCSIKVLCLTCTHLMLSFPGFQIKNYTKCLQTACCYCYLVANSRPTLSVDSMDDSPSGSSVHGIFQARILEWVAISFSMGSSQPRDRHWVSCMGRSVLFFYHWATREARTVRCLWAMQFLPWLRFKPTLLWSQQSPTHYMIRLP